MIHSYYISFLKKDWFWNNTFSEFRRKEIDSFAHILSEALHNEPRQEISAAQNSLQVIIGRNFLRNLTVDSPEIRTLKSELMAAKLGIRREIFEKNPGFEEFATKNHLERYLLGYRHRIAVKAGKVFLRVNSENSMQEKPWEEVREILHNFRKITRAPSQPWLYGPLGLQNKDMYDWHELEPFKWEDAETWKTQYIFEICVFLTGSPSSLTGNHSWLRLRTPAGSIYSVGLYRTGKRGPRPHVSFPLRTMSGELMSPDVSEFWPTKGKEEIRSWQFSISSEAFLKIKKNIEEEKNQGMQPFEDFDPNCSKWVVEKAKIAGINLHATENIISLFTPRKVEQVAQSVWNYVPLKIGSRIRVSVAFCVNTLQLLFGAGRVDPAVQEKMMVEPRIANWMDLFNPQKMMVYHPYTLADKTMPAIEAWREQEKIRISEEKPVDMEKRLSKIAYSAPSGVV